mgnify:CR=1 FL=1
MSLSITGMTCASCVGHVAQALEEVSGVDEVNVNLATERATVSTGNSAVTLDDLVFAIKDAGYGVVTQKVTLSIGAMTCATCVGHVDHALSDVGGVVSASVNLATERATVEYVRGTGCFRHGSRSGEPDPSNSLDTDVPTLLLSTGFWTITQIDRLS